MMPDVQIEEKLHTSSGNTDKNLDLATRILFILAVVGQWIFVYYIVKFYGGIVVSGAYEKVNEQLPHGIIEGDVIGNAMLAVHLFLAAVITFAGPLQFFPVIRKQFPVFHRWNGRIYFVTAILTASAGLYMNFTRGAHGGFLMALGNGSNALLIMAFSTMAWRTAMNRDFKAHKKWAVRAFVMVSGVWFFRVGYGLWILLTGFTAPGTNGDLTGGFDRFLAIGHWLVPLLILELYFYAKVHSSLAVKKLATISLAVLCLLLIGGIGIVTMFFWAPVL